MLKYILKYIGLYFMLYRKNFRKRLFFVVIPASANYHGTPLQRGENAMESVHAAKMQFDDSTNIIRGSVHASMKDKRRKSVSVWNAFPYTANENEIKKIIKENKQYTAPSLSTVEGN